MDAKAILDHQFVVAAYSVTWIIQLGYLAWLAFKWRAQKREAARNLRRSR
jgi:threonine/homoserine/homoserine lactone efflux protein